MSSHPSEACDALFQVCLESEVCAGEILAQLNNLTNFYRLELNPMLIIQCKCSNCRKLSGSYQIEYLYSVLEIEGTGETASYSFEGGGEYMNTVHFYAGCHVSCKTNPPTEVIEGMVGIPLGTFDTAKERSTIG